MNLYFYIRTWLCVSCGYKKKNTWQRARAVRQVQSFHSKHICVCWASVALGRQARGAAPAGLQSLGLPSTGRETTPWQLQMCRLQLEHAGEHLRDGTGKKSFPASLHADCTCVKSKCTSSLECAAWRKQPGDTSTKAQLCCCALFCGSFFYYYFIYLLSGAYCLGSCSLGRLRRCLTLAEIYLLTCRALLSQHQCKGDSNKPVLVGFVVICVKAEYRGKAWRRHRRKLGEECAQGMPGPGRGSLGREDQGLTMTSVIPVLWGQGGWKNSKWMHPSRWLLFFLLIPVCKLWCTTLPATLLFLLPHRVSWNMLNKGQKDNKKNWRKVLSN